MSSIYTVGDQKPVYHVPEDIVDEGLKDWQVVSQSKRHYQVLILTCWVEKGCLPLIPLLYSDEVVSTSQVQFSKNLGFMELFQCSGRGSLLFLWSCSVPSNQCTEAAHHPSFPWRRIQLQRHRLRGGWYLGPVLRLNKSTSIPPQQWTGSRAGSTGGLLHPGVWWHSPRVDVGVRFILDL